MVEIFPDQPGEAIIEPPPLPVDLQDFIDRGQWPRGHFSGKNLEDVAKFLRGVNIDLLDLWGRPPPWKPLARPVGAVDSKYKMFRGSQLGHDIPLPWIDVERVQKIGQGAYYGDDVSILLDYRPPGAEPSVVALRYSRSGKDWVRIAPDWRTFLVLLLRTPEELEPAAMKRAEMLRESMRRGGTTS